MTATVSLRGAPDCACPACRRYVDALADLEAAGRGRGHPRHEAMAAPGLALSRDLRHAAAASDRVHGDGASMPLDPEPGRDRSRALIGGPLYRDHDERQDEVPGPAIDDRREPL